MTKKTKSLASKSRNAIDRSILNVYAESDDEVDTRARTADALESYEFQMDEIASGDDEEIDEDMAFADSDDERFASFKFYTDSESKGKAVAKNDKPSKADDLSMISEHSSIDLNSDIDNQDDEQDENSEEDGAIDLSEMLMSGTSMLPGATYSKQGLTLSDAEEDDLHDSLLYSDADLDEEDSERDLTSVIDNLSTDTKRKRNTSTHPTKRQRMEEATEAYKESEHNLPSSRSGTKLDLGAMLGALQSHDEFAGLKRQLKQLNTDIEQSRKLTAPLPQRVQNRLNRVAAYEETKKEVNKWQPIVEKNREAEHIDFTNTKDLKVRSSTAQLASQFKPQTSLEMQINQALEQTGNLEDKIVQQEELALCRLSKTEVLARQNELRHMRELMFREEAKLKRIAKIKSKTYRKIKKKEKDRLQAQSHISIVDLMKLDPAAAQEEILKLETERAKERMSLRHKNTGKWAKFMLKQGSDGADVTRQAIVEQMLRQEALKAKIAGIPVDGVGEFNDHQNNTLTATMLRDVQELEADIQRESGTSKQDTKGIVGMKFMQRALAAQKSEAQQMLEQLKQDLQQEGDEDEDEEDTIQTQGEDSSHNYGQSNHNGRLVVSNKNSRAGVSALQLKGNVLPIILVNDSTAHHSATSGPVSVLNAAIKANGAGTDMAEFTVEDAWSTTTTSQDRLSKSPVLKQAKHNKSLKTAKSKNVKKSNENIISETNLKDNTTTETKDKSNKKAKVKAKEAKVNARQGVETNTVKRIATASKSSIPTVTNVSGRIASFESIDNIDNEDVTINPWLHDSVSVVKKAARTIKKTHRNQDNVANSAQKLKQIQKKAIERQAPVDDNGQSTHLQDVDFDDESASALIFTTYSKNAYTPFTQHELVAAAFANDNVVAEFERDKRAVENADAPKEEDLTLPGWGSWGGTGTNNIPKKVVVKHIPGVIKTERKDAHLKNVIINEKKAKKLVKYQVTSIPYPYETRAQYELAMQQSLGKEWNTHKTFTSVIKPRIFVHSGSTINPLTHGKVADKNGNDNAANNDGPENTRILKKTITGATKSKTQRRANSRL